MYRENVQIKMDNVCRNIIWFHSRMSNLAQLSNPLFFSRLNVSRDNPAHAHKRDRWVEIASFCLLILEEKINCVTEFALVIWCMFWVLPSSRTATVKRTDLASLKCIQFGLLLRVAAGWLCFCFYNKLFDPRRHIIRSCWGKFTQINRRWHNRSGKLLLVFTSWGQRSISD